MSAYYNEIDPYCAQWLRNLIKAGLIADGEVDERSITAVQAREIVGFTQCHFFAGLGGWAGALRLAGFPDDRPVWTGSCPCQPFSLAGKQKGFADDRHLWPVWRDLIAERRPAKVYGEQVASAAQWLRLVRGDLEALDYAVGAIPIEAASAGADHLRDRFWFVGDDPSERRREGWAEHAVRSGWPATASDGSLEHASIIPEREPDHQGYTEPDERQARPVSGGPSDLGVGLADANDPRSQGWQLLPERPDQRPAGPDGLADAHRDDSKIDWVIGADGKARRVKSGIRLLAHGVLARVAKLRALGNAIDIRPAAAFIRATS